MAGPHSETATSALSVRFSRCSGFVAPELGVAIEGVNLLLIGGGLRIVHASLHEGIAFALTRLGKRNIERAARAAGQVSQLMGVERPAVGLTGIDSQAGSSGGRASTSPNPQRGTCATKASR